MKTRIALSLGGNSQATDETYVAALSRPEYGLEICSLLPSTPPDAAAEVLRTCSGLVLTGGADVNPARYGEEPAGAEMRFVSDARDNLELSLLQGADERDLPVFAICRGMQVLNVHRGGALLQHIGESHRDGRAQDEKWRPFHEVALAAGSLHAAIAGSPTVHTNSRHHQALDPARLGRDLMVTGRCANDGVIEAVQGPVGRFLVGVQWHPENMATGPESTPERDQARAYFAAFAAAARGYPKS